METVRELLIALGLDVHQAEFVEAIGLEHLLEKASEMLVEVLKEIPAQLIEVVEATAEYAHKLEDMSERTGISTESLQQFGYIAGLAGISTEEMEMSVNHLSRTMASARDGNVEAGLAFAKLGVRVTDAHGKLRQTDEVLGDLADGFEKLPKGPERTAIAMDIFSRGGAKMLNVLHGGKKGVEALKKEFEALGLGMDEDAIEKGAALETSFKRIGMVIDALKRDLAGPLIEALGPIVDDIMEWVKANRALIKTRIQDFARGVVAVSKVLLAVLKKVGEVLLFVVDHAKFFAVIIGGVVVAALAVNSAAIISTIGWYVALSIQAARTAAVAALAWLKAVWPALLLVAAFTALLLILDDVRGYLNGEDSLIGDIGPKWSKFLSDFTKPMAGDPWWLTAIKFALKYLTDIQKIWDDLGFTKKDTAPSQQEIDAFTTGRHLAERAPMFSSPQSAASQASFTPAASMGDVNASFVINAPAGTSAEQIAHAATSNLEDFMARQSRQVIESGGG